ncbi:MAG: translocation/assembly module TamB domain-containing protein [Nitrospirota bacterium]
MKKKGWLILFSLIVVISTGISILFYIYRERIEEKIKEIAVSRIEESLGIKAEINDLSIRLFPASFEVDNLLLERKTDEIESSIKIRNARVYFSLWSLITEIFFVKEIIINDPEVSIEIKNKTNDFRDIIQALPYNIRSKGKTPTPVIVRKLLIRNAAIGYSYSDSIIRTDITGMNAEVTPDLRMKNFRISFSIEKIILNNENISQELSKIDGRIKVGENRIDIKRLRVDSKDITLDIKGSINNLDDPYLDLLIDSNIELESVSPVFAYLTGLPMSINDIKGSAEIKGAISGRLKDISGKGRLSIRDIFFEKSRVGNISSEFSYQDGVVTISDLSGNLLKGEMSGDLTISLLELPPLFNASLEFKEITPYLIERYLPFDLPLLTDAEVSGKVKFTGRGLQRDRFSGTGEVNITYGGHDRHDTNDSVNPIFSVIKRTDLKFEFKGSHFRLYDTDIITEKSSLSLDGRIDINGDLDLSIQIESDDIREIAGLAGYKKIEGGIILSGVLTGNYLNPVFHGEITSNDTRIKGKRIGSLYSEIDLKDREVMFKKAQLKKDDSIYEFSGNISFKDKDKESLSLNNPYFNVKIKVKHGIPNNVISLFYKEISLYTFADGKLSYRGNKDKFTVKGDLVLKDGSIYGQMFDNGRVILEIDKKRILFSDAAIYNGDSSWEGNGWISFDGHFNSHIYTSDNAYLEDITHINNLLPRLKGKISGIIKGKGRLKNPDISLAMTIHNIGYSDRELGQGIMKVNLTDKKAKVNLSINGEIIAAGNIDLTHDYPFAGEIKLSELQLNPFIDYLRIKPSLINSAYTTGRIKVDGHLSPVKDITISVSLSKLFIDISGYEISNDGDIVFVWKEGDIKIDSFPLKGKGTALTVRGKLRPFEKYELILNGEADLNLLDVLSEEIMYGKGKTYLSLKISDRWDDPEIRGGITLENGIITSKSLNQKIMINSLNLFFNERHIILDSFDGRMGRGNLRAAGRIDVKNFEIEHYQLLLETFDTRISIFEGLSALFDGSFIFEGDKKERKLNGEVFINSASYNKRVEWGNWILEFLTADKDRRSELPPLIADIPLNINITGKENIWINNNLAKIPLEIDLFVKGMIDNPLILGRIEAREGTIFFRRNEFKLISGSIDFINPEKTEAIIDVVARTTIKRYAIELGLTGKKDKFDLTLTSDPYLSKTDILALLTVGITADEIAKTSTEVGATEAVTLITGEIQDAIERKIEDLTGFDRFQVAPSYSGSKGSASPRLTVGKRLLEDKLFVIYSTGFDPEDEPLIQLEYTLKKNIFLLGERDERGRLGSEVKFRFEFR